jgi:hypothetical protein
MKTISSTTHGRAQATPTRLIAIKADNILLIAGPWDGDVAGMEWNQNHPMIATLATDDVAEMLDRAVSVGLSGSGGSSIQHFLEYGVRFTIEVAG